MTNELADTVSILLGRVTGLFRGALNYSVGTGPSSIAVGDFNRDGKLDLAVVNRGSNTLTVLTSKATGLFGVWRRCPRRVGFRQCSRPTSTATASST